MHMDCGIVRAKSWYSFDGVKYDYRRSILTYFRYTYCKPHKAHPLAAYYGNANDRIFRSRTYSAILATLELLRLLVALTLVGLEVTLA